MKHNDYVIFYGLYYKYTSEVIAIYWLYLNNHYKRVTFRLKGFTAIALIRSIKLSNSKDHKQALLANNNSNNLLNFSLLPQLYHLGKMNLKLLQLIMDIRSHQLRHSLPTFLKECPLPFGVANFAVIYVCQYSFMRMVAKSLRSTFLKKNLKRNVTFQTGPQSTFFTKTKNPLFCFPSLVKRCKTSTSLVTTDNQIKNYFFKANFSFYM